MSENVGASITHNSKGLQGLYRDDFTFLHFVTTNKYNSFADFHTESSQPTFTSVYLVTALNSDSSSAMSLLDVFW
jgi:hypothetical protein